MASDPFALLHQVVRMRIMAMLWRHRDLAVTEIRDHLQLTDGNMASHLRKLAEANYVDSRKALDAAGFQNRVRITAVGVAAFSEYLAALQQFVAEAEPESTD